MKDGSQLGYAVCLIDGDETDVHVTELGLEEFGRQSLWGDIQNLDITEDTVLKDDNDLLACES